MSEENKYILEVKDLHTSFFTDAGAHGPAFIPAGGTSRAAGGPAAGPRPGTKGALLPNTLHL